MIATANAASITVAGFLIVAPQPTNAQSFWTSQEKASTTNAIIGSLLTFPSEPASTNAEPSGTAMGAANYLTNSFDPIFEAKLFVNQANAALQISNFTAAVVSAKAATAIYEVNASSCTNFPNELMVGIYWTAAMTEHKLGHLSEAIEHARKPMSINPTALAAEAEAMALYWESNDIAAADLLREWYDPDPSNPLNLAGVPRQTPRTPANESGAALFVNGLRSH